MAKYVSDMRRFTYDATLHIRHPTISPAEITRQIGRNPKRSHAVGTSKSTPAGTPRLGEWKDNFWLAELETIDGQDIVEFLAKLLEQLRPCRDFLQQVSDTGGEVCCFVGVYTDRCCAHQFSRQLLADLAGLGLDLRLDIYGQDLPQKGLRIEG